MIAAAVDESPTGLRALAYAMGLARRSSAELTVVHVEEPPPTFCRAAEDVDRWQADQSATTTWLRGVLHGVQGCRLLSVAGHPLPEITRVVRGMRTDALVVGASEGHRLLTVAVGPRLVRAAICPVVVVP